MSLLDWFFGKNDDPLGVVIDLPFVRTDLKEIHQTDAEIFTCNQHDNMAAQAAQRAQASDVPIGKRVI